MDFFSFTKHFLFNFPISRLHNMAADNIFFFFIIKRETEKRDTGRERNRVRSNDSNRETEFLLDLNLVYREGTLSSSHKGPCG